MQLPLILQQDRAQSQEASSKTMHKVKSGENVCHQTLHAPERLPVGKYGAH